MKKITTGSSLSENKSSLPPLLLCVLLDAVGYVSFSIPLIGEFADVIWAPLSAMIYYRLFGGRMGLFGGAFSFLEEILPFTDIIPTFTLSWYMRKRALDKNAALQNLKIIRG